jgi:hypothetical protein
MKKLLMISIFTLTLITLAACSFGQNLNLSAKVFETKEDIYAFSAVSTLAAFTELENASLNNNHQTSNFLALSTNLETFSNDPLDMIEELEPYLKLVETFMGQDNGFTVEILASDLEGYETLMQITVIDITGEPITYDFYYNETILTDEDDEADLDDEDDKADLDDEEDEVDEEELESILEGILVLNGVNYTFYGEREFELGEESFEMTASIDAENYVTIKYEMEQDSQEVETEFILEVFQNNQLVKSIEIEFEQDNEETELTLKFLENGLESEFDFEITTENGTQKIEIDYKITDQGVLVEEGEIEVMVTYDALTNSYTVKYEIKVENEEGIVFEKEYDQDEDDDFEDNEDEEVEEDSLMA